MKWQDKAIILGAKSFGETSLILEVFSANHGFHKGLVKGGATKSKKALIQPGNLVNVTWNARLHEQLGLFNIEVEKYYSIYLIQNIIMLYGFEILRFYLKTLAEREANNNLYELLLSFLQFTNSNGLDLAEAFIKFEFAYIYAMGVGPDLSCCVVTGTATNLCYISPRSLQAVSYEIGKDWHDKLLPLPKFLLQNCKAENGEEILKGYNLTTYFIKHNIIKDQATNLMLTRKNFIYNIKECNEFLNANNL